MQECGVGQRGASMSGQGHNLKFSPRAQQVRFTLRKRTWSESAGRSEMRHEERQRRSSCSLLQRLGDLAGDADDKPCDWAERAVFQGDDSVWYGDDWKCDRQHPQV